MKLKLIVAAIGLVASAASQATIIPTTTPGGSDLLLNVWEQGAPDGSLDQSFTLNLGLTLTQYVNLVSSSNFTSPVTLSTLLSSDSTWSNFLATSDTADAGVLQWSVIASGNKVPTTRPAILGTVTAGTDPTTQGSYGFLTNQNIIDANTQVATTVTTLANAATPDEQVSVKGSKGYFQTYNLASYNTKGFFNSNVIGATNISVETAANIGSAPTAAAMTQLNGVMDFSKVGSSYVLTVSPAPEAPGSALMLAGLGALSLLALRRKNV